jgi:hypothetical protein
VSRRLAPSVAPGAGISIVAPATPAQAIARCPAGYQCITWYYSDSQHANVVGSSSVRCNGAYNSVGILSQYAVAESDLCGGSHATRTR